MTTNNILAAVRRKILEATTEVVADATLLEYLQQSYQDIVRRWFPNASVKTASVVFTNGVGSPPADFGTMYGDAYENAYSIYPEMSIGDFARNTDENAITGQAGFLKIYPAVSKTLTIPYYPSYVALAGGTIDPSIDSYFDELNIYGVMFRVYEDLQDEELSTYYEDKYEKKLALKKKVASNYEDGNQRGGQMFNPIQIVSDNSPFSNSPNQI